MFGRKPKCPICNAELKEIFNELVCTNCGWPYRNKDKKYDPYRPRNQYVEKWLERYHPELKDREKY